MTQYIKRQAKQRHSLSNKSAVVRSVLILTLSLLIDSQSAFAQQFEWSNPERFRNRSTYSQVLGENSSGYFIVRHKNRNWSNQLIIERYKANMGRDFSKKITASKGAKFESIVVCDSGLLFIFSRFNVKSEKIELFSQLYDNEAEPAVEPQLISTVLPKSYNDDGNFMLSANDSNTFVAYSFTEYAGKNKSMVTLGLIESSTGRLVYENKQTFDIELERIRQEQLLADENKQVFLLMSFTDYKYRNNAPEYLGHYLLAQNPAENKMLVFYLNFPELFVYNLKMTLDRSKERLLVSGFFSLEARNKLRGNLHFSLFLKGLTIEFHDFKPFSFNLVADAIGLKAAEKDEEIADYEIKAIISRTDGGLIILAEEFYVSQQNYTYYINGMPQINTRSIFNYGKIMVIALNYEGELQWSKLINKSQTSLNDYGQYSSFFWHVLPDQIAIVFNDKLRGAGDVFYFKLKNDGTLENDILFREGNAFISLVALEAKQLDAFTSIFPTAKDRKFAFLKIIF